MPVVWQLELFPDLPSFETDGMLPLVAKIGRSALPT